MTNVRISIAIPYVACLKDVACLILFTAALTGCVEEGVPAGGTSDVASTGSLQGDDPPAAESGQLEMESAQPATLAVDSSGRVALSPGNTMIQFVGTHVGDEPNPRTGYFTRFSGTAQFDETGQLLKAVSVDIETESLITSIDRLTNHLRSADFFDVRQYPTARFVSTSVTPREGPGNIVITGNLTILKTTREISFPAKIQVREAALTLDAETAINRLDFDIGIGQDRVVNEVKLTIAIGKKTPTL